MKKIRMSKEEAKIRALWKQYIKEMRDLEAMYNDGEINYQDRGLLKLYIWGKECYRPLYQANMIDC